MLLGTSPAVHVRSRTLYGPGEEDRAIRRAAQGVRFTGELAPIAFGNKLIGSVYGHPDGRVAFLKPSQFDLAGFPGGYSDIITAVQAGQTAFGLQWISNVAGVSGDGWTDTWPSQFAVPADGYTGTALTSRRFDDTSVGALYHGGNVSPAQKYVSGAQLTSKAGTTPGFMFWLYDRVITYDECTISTSTQTFTTTLTAQRWVGTGLPALRAMATAGKTGGGATPSAWATLVYTNEGGTGSRSTTFSVTTSCPINYNAVPNFTATGYGSNVLPLDTANFFDLGPFFPLAPGDIGAQSLTNYTLTANNTGTMCYAMVRPLVMLLGPPTEQTRTIDFVKDKLALARIYDGACLSTLLYVADNSSTTPDHVNGYTFVWN